MKSLWRRITTGDDGTLAVDLDFPACVQREFPAEFAPAWDAVQRVLSASSRSDLAPLATRSPALRGYDWNRYLSCSVVRMARALEMLRRYGIGSGRVLDYGAYFGNFSLMCSVVGYAVDAIDGYRSYEGALDGCVALLTGAGVRVFDFAETGYALTTTLDGAYDAVLCMGILEHIAHTPRPLLDTLDRVLRPGGVLLIDTPNLAYIYNREKLARGQSVFYPIESQYYSDIPFEGHHREYTADELRWMLEQLQHESIEIQTFNYSHFGLPRLSGAHARLYEQMARDPSSREVLLSASRKPS
jgi:2-polyprenyl-3-methyl-5-hydroxy-6-metoxy-1,4-benzoquinol methylase